MNKRECVLTALNHQQPEHIPYHVQFTRLMQQRMSEYYREEDFESRLGNFLIVRNTKPAQAEVEVKPAFIRDQFGIIWDRTVDQDIGVPTEKIITPETIDDFQFPDPDDPSRYADYEAVRLAYPDQFFVVNHSKALFEIAWMLAGMQELMMAMICDPDYAHKLFDKILDFNLRVIDKACAHDIDAMMLHETILDQPWCLSLEKSTTPNKVLLVMTKGQVTAARDWVDNTLLTIYTQHILDKLDITTLQQIVPRHLDKPIITAASHTYAEKLKQHTAMVTTAPTKQNPLNCPPRKRIMKPVDITFAEQDFPWLPTTQQPPPAATIATTANDPAPTQQPPFDYQATLDCITKDVEMTLKAKFDAAIANLQQSFMNLERRVDQKLQSHMDTMKASQADKATQDDHTQRLEQVTKTLDTLVAQMHVLLDS